MPIASRAAMRNDRKCKNERLKGTQKTCGTDAQCMRQTQHGLPRKSMENPTGSREQNTIIASKEQKFMRDKCAMHETNTAWATKKGDIGSMRKKRHRETQIMRDKCAMHETHGKGDQK